jgi:hypothetical protein
MEVVDGIAGSFGGGEVAAATGIRDFEFVQAKLLQCPTENKAGCKDGRGADSVGAWAK